MRVTVAFNIGMTLAAIGYATLLFPTFTDDPTRWMVESMFPERLEMQAATVLLSIVLATIVFMFLFRAVWNRLFPHLCGWKPINLAESYAFSVLGMLLFPYGSW